MATAKTNDTPTRSVEELEALLAEKEAKLAAMEAEKAKKEEKLAAMEAATAAPNAPTNAYSEDREKLMRNVTIRLPITGNNKEPLFVRFNEKTFTIRRGVDVSIPYYLWLHIMECQQADDASSVRMNDLSGAFTNQVEAYKL